MINRETPDHAASFGLGFLWKPILLVLIAVGIYVAYMWATYIDETVETGSAYGLSIGMSKRSVLEALQRQYADKKIFIEYPIGRGVHGPLDDFRFREEDIKKVEDNMIWKFYFGERDRITLRFEQERLVSIHRHRQYFEFP